MTHDALRRLARAAAVLAVLSALLSSRPLFAAGGFPARDDTRPVADVSPRARAILDTLKPDPEDLARDYPVYWNWSEMGGVTPLRDQGTCETCWAFAAYADVESGVLRTQGLALDLAEQQANDCNTWGSDCDHGGWIEGAFELVMSPGAVAEGCMPYLNNDGDCAQRLCEKVAFLDGWEYVAGDVSSYKAAIMEGPIPACDGYHCVLIVGWNDAYQHWICKDSLGAMWSYYPYTSAMTWGTVRALNPHAAVVRLVPDEFDTIQDAVDASERGDAIWVTGGTYAESVTLPPMRSLLGGFDPTFTVRDPDLYPTVIDAQGALYGIVCGTAGTGSEASIIDGLRVTNASGEGILMWTGDGAAIANTVVHGCGSGIRILEGSYSIGYVPHSVRVEHCTIRDNSGAGVRIVDVALADVALSWTAVYGNGGSGVVSDDAPTSIVNCTVASNEGHGVELVGGTQNTVLSSIVAANGACGVAASGAEAEITFSDVWGNDAGDLLGCALGLGSISEDPVFCDLGAADLTLHASSPCHGAGDFGQDMGALGVACPIGPQNVALAQQGASFLLSWSPPPGDSPPERYVVYRDTLGGGAEPIAAVTPPETTFVDVTIPACAIHDYSVTAVDTSGLEGAHSNVVSGELCYEGPRDLEVVFSVDGHELSWSAADGPVDRYAVVRSTTEAQPDTVGWVPASETAYVDTAISDCVRNNRSYEVVPVYDTGWRGAASERVTVDPAPSPPLNLAAEWLGSDVALTWSPNCEDDVRRYWIYRDETPFLPPVNSELLIGFTADTTFIDPAAVPGSVYFYRATASDASSLKSTYSDFAFVGAGEVLTVPVPFATIQGAIDAASPLDTVLVAAGVYDEQILLKDGVSVMADRRSVVTIRHGTGAVVAAPSLSSLASLEGFTIDGLGSAQSGIDALGSYLHVDGCEFRGAVSGASFRFGGAPVLSGNVFTANQYGIACADSASPFLALNTFDGNAVSAVANWGSPGPVVGGSLANANDFVNRGLFHVMNAGAAEVEAEANYWGDLCVDPGWFAGAVDYVPWTDEDHNALYVDCYGTTPGEGTADEASASDSYPNPFNPSTSIRYSVPAPGGPVRLAIYNLAGRKVRTLVDAWVPSGVHEALWEGRDDAGRELGSGVYFYRLEIGTEFRAERKMVMLR